MIKLKIKLSICENYMIAWIYIYTFSFKTQIIFLKNRPNLIKVYLDNISYYEIRNVKQSKYYLN